MQARLVYIGVFAWRKRPTVSPKISMIFLSQDNQCYDRTLGVTFCKNRTFSIFQTATSQGQNANVFVEVKTPM